MNRVSFSVVAMFVVAASAVSAQMVRPGIIMPPRDVGAAAPEGTGRIRGRVLMADGGAPLRRAQVMIISQEVGIRRMTTTDANGRYEFARLPAGQYNITASKGGYVTLQVGQRRPFEPGTPVRIADGQTLNDVDAALPRGGVIGGRVTDEFGEPLAGAQVQALRYQDMPVADARTLVRRGPLRHDRRSRTVPRLRPDARRIRRQCRAAPARDGARTRQHDRHERGLRANLLSEHPKRRRGATGDRRAQSGIVGAYRPRCRANGARVRHGGRFDRAPGFRRHGVHALLIRRRDE